MLLLTLYIALLAVFSEAAYTNYTNATNVSSTNDEYSHSPPFYPTPQGGRINDAKWVSAYKSARLLVEDLTVAEKVNLTTGVGIGSGPCSGNTGSIPRLNISSICLQDGPLSVRGTDLTTVFPAGISTSATFNKQLIYDRAVALGAEFKGKGVDVLLGPVYGPLGVKAQGGRGWEGFGPDPYLEGVAAYLSTLGIQSQGVISTAKHLIGNEQEHYRLPWTELLSPFDYPHNTTDSISSDIDDRALHEIYVWPFAEAVRAGLGAVMCSYNRLNGTHASQNSHLLNYILKEELGFQGFVMTDWFALFGGVDAAIAGLDMDMPGEPQYFGGNLTLATLNGSLPIERLDDMATRILASLIYTGVNNPDGPNYDTSTFDTYGHQHYYAQEGPIVRLNQHVDVRTEFSRKVALNTATEAIVLLKNVNETLPLTKKKTKNLGIFGQAARADPNEPNCMRSGCLDGAVAAGYGSGSGTLTYFIDPADGIGAGAIKKGIAYGIVTDSWDFNGAYEVAQSSDTVIIVANNVAGEEHVGTSGNKGDLYNLTLWHNAEALIKNITSVNNNTILILNTALQVDLENFIDNENITAVVYSGYLGQDYGTALSKIIFGDENPSGRLPFTIGKNVEDYIPLVLNQTVDKPVDRFNESIFVDYRYFDYYNKPVRYEFGYGLSYSNFTLSDIKVVTKEEFTESIEEAQDDYLEVYNSTNTNLDPEDNLYPEGFTPVTGYTYSFINSTDGITKNESYPYPEGYSTKQLTKPASLAAGGLGGNPHLWDVGFTVSAQLKNNGPYDGAFVAQLYVSFPDSDEFPTAPVQLRGFDKVFLEDGYSQSVVFDITRKDLSVWDTKTQTWKVLRGEYKFYVGSSSRQLDLVETIALN